MTSRFSTIFVLIILFSAGVFGQDAVEKVRKQKESTLKEIEYANKLLEETRGKTKESLNEISLINKKLSKRKEFLVSLEAEAGLISNSIEENNQVVLSLKKEIDVINEVYARMIYNMYKNKSKNNYLMYFLASENMNQLYKRIRYMRLYNRYLKIQRERLTAVKEEIIRKNELLSLLRQEKDNVMLATKKENGMIESEMERKRRMVDQLNKKQRDIKTEIRNKEKVAKKLDDEIKRIIEAEMAKTKKSTGKENITPAEKIVSNDFAKNQGMLPWPTQKGLVTGKYGEHDHPDFKSVKIRNDGVYISTSKGEYARTVFKGTVSRVFSIPGENYTVILKHGMYYTLYHNLTDVRVKAGQTVETKEIIGKVFTNENTGETTLYFQVWKETERNDPELWLAR